MNARIFVRLKSTVLDPQGQAIARSLNVHGHPRVEEVRQGKVFEVRLAADSAEAAHAELERIAHDVLANPVIEEWEVELLP